MKQALYKEKNGVKYALNPTNEELAWHLENVTLKALKGFLTEDNNLCVWDSVLWMHDEVSRRLQIDGGKFNINHIKDNYVIISRSEDDKAKLLTSTSVRATGLKII